MNYFKKTIKKKVVNDSLQNKSAQVHILVSNFLEFNYDNKRTYV